MERLDSEYFMSSNGDNDDFYVTSEVKADFDKNGYIIVRGLLSPPEVERLRHCMENSEDIKRHAYGRNDGKGRQSKLCIWNFAGNDVTGVVARSQKVAGTMQQLLGGDEIYHYHSKLMMKEAHTGGAHVWHQDYGYWYENGCLLPEMGAIFMPVDKCTKKNSCLQVLKGSHKMGRINHNLSGDQAGADLERLQEAKEVFPLVYVELDPGDTLFFHCNLLHSSDQNHSDMRRWVMITSMNKKLNNPTRQHHHPQYHPLRMLPNSAILDCNVMNSSEEKWYVVPQRFMDPKTDSSAKSTGRK